MKGDIEQRNLAEACEEYSCLFGTNKNVYRSMPRMQDGLKPVAGRILYALYKNNGLTKFKKMFKVSADAMSYHPHGGDSMTDVAVRMAQSWTNNCCLLEPGGNFGNARGDDNGAERYIEARLSKYADYCFFKDFEYYSIDMKPSYTGDDEEPEALPARYPHAIINPQISGIGLTLDPLSSDR